jgi:hypothetical protein
VKKRSKKSKHVANQPDSTTQEQDELIKSMDIPIFGGQGVLQDEDYYQITSPDEANAKAILDSINAADLSTIKESWYFGEWDKLAAVDIEKLHTHPEVAKLAALKATGFQQLGDMGNCRKYAQIAKRLGCDNILLARLLISGVHNSLGRISALHDQKDKVAYHFGQAVNVGAFTDNRLAKQSRTIRELAKIGLMDQVIEVIDDVSKGKVEEITIQAKLTFLQQELSRLKKDLNTNPIAPATEHSRQNDCIYLPRMLLKKQKISILVAGMRHSGSTALFNIIRLALEQNLTDYISGYSEQIKVDELDFNQTQVELLKTHELRDDVLRRATFIFTTKRDLRDTVASAVRRKFPTLERVGGATEYAKYNRSIYEQWSNKSDFEFCYEEFIKQPLSVIQKVLSVIGLIKLDHVDIYNQLMNLPTDQYSKTLLSATHITDPTRERNYLNTLSDKDIQMIDSQHSGWLQQNGYQQQSNSKEPND